MRFLDTTVSAGNTYEYRVRVTDPHGNSTVSAWTSVTIAADGPYSAFNQAVLDSGPSAYWPLSETSGTAGYDWGGINNQALSSSGITRGVTGPNLNALSLATHFSGTSGVSGYSTKILDGPPGIQRRGMVPHG